MNKTYTLLSILSLLMCCSSVFAQKRGGQNCATASIGARVIPSFPFTQRDTLYRSSPAIDQINDYHGGNTTLPSGMSPNYMTGRDYVYRFTATQTGPVQIQVSYQMSARYFSLLLFEAAAGPSFGQCLGYTYEVSTAGMALPYPTGIVLIANVKAGVDYFILVDCEAWYAGTNNLRSQYIISADYIPLQTECVNLGFENGDFSNWIGTSGKSLSCKNPLAINVNYTPVFVGTATAQHSIAGVGTDPFGGFSKTYAGNYSAKLGDDTLNGCGGSQLIQSFIVTPATNYYIYHYAVVFENGITHPHDTINSMVKLTTLDDNGDTIPGAQYLGIISASSPGFIRVGATDVYYRPWVTQMVDLTSQVGRMVTLLFTVTDCNAGEHFGYAYFDSECSTVPVPVELTHFGAINNESTIDLYWRTQSETNSDYYIVEKSSNNFDFYYVGRTSAAGNSNSEMTYSTTDFSPISGTSYYRLTQFDRDGTSTIFPAITVNHNDVSDVSFTAYPNPATGDVLTIDVESEIASSSNLLLELRDIAGNIIVSVIVEGPRTNMEIARLQHGTYILQLVSKSIVIKELLIVK